MVTQKLIEKYRSQMKEALKLLGQSCGTEPETVHRVIRTAVTVLGPQLGFGEKDFFLQPEYVIEDVNRFYDFLERYEETYFETSKNIDLIPNQKIKVFISSICDVPKYDKVRKELKDAIEATQLAKVYLFEAEEASTSPAGSHYIWTLEDSDVCIFLIDNADGINPGVQREIDVVKRNNIKSLSYFCDETSKEKTTFELEQIGAQFSKTKTVHSFEELSQHGAQALIDDIVFVYHNFCVGRYVQSDQAEKEEFQSIRLPKMEQIQLPEIPKTIIKDIDKSKEKILSFILSQPYKINGDGENTSEIDLWASQFLSVLLERKSMREFNAGMYLESIKDFQTEKHYSLVQIRWEAIQAYFLGDVGKCIEKLNAALEIAKANSHPIWVIKDILIDLRNMQQLKNTLENTIWSEDSAQKELGDSEEELYYPVLDRVYDSLNQKYLDGNYKEKIQSPHTVVMGNNLDMYGSLLASAFIIAMYNGSLTHLLLFPEKLKDFLFYLSGKYSDWNFKRDLMKLEIYAGSSKKVKQIQTSYPEILNNLNSDDALEIMLFCENQPIVHKRIISQTIAFCAVGCYLDDEKFELYEKLFVEQIKKWLLNDSRTFAIYQNVFDSLQDVAYRMSQDTLAEICCMFMDKHLTRWYMDMFKFMSVRLDLNRMSDESARKLIEHIISVLETEKEREWIQQKPMFLCSFRKQNKSLTEELDGKIKEYLNEFYSGIYRVETTEDKQHDYLLFMQKYIKRVESTNATQGKNGVYYGYSTRDMGNIKNLLLQQEFTRDTETMDMLIPIAVNALVNVREIVSFKLDAISLLICIVQKYPEDYKRNQIHYNKIVEMKDAIEIIDTSFLSSNVDTIAVKIGLQLLFTAMELDTHSEILCLMPHIQNDTATTIAVVKLIAEYLGIEDNIVFPEKIEAIVLQNVLQWLRSENLDIRWYSVKILLALLRNSLNENIINQQLINLVNTDNVFIKNFILRNLYRTKGISSETQDYILKKCAGDSNYLVRMVCEEMRNEYQIKDKD